MALFEKENDNIIEKEDQRGVNTLNLKSIRTFESDVALALKDKNASLVSIALAEKTKRLQEEKELSEKESLSGIKSKNLIFVSIVIVFMAIVATIAFYLYNNQEKKVLEVVEIKKEVQNIIKTDFQKDFKYSAQSNLDKSSLYKDLNSLDLRIGDTGELFVSSDEKTVFSSLDFLSFLGIYPPVLFSKNLDPEFVYGEANLRGEDKAFLVFKTKFFEGAFSGLIDWEENMVKDVGDLLNTSSVDGRFVDLSVNNQDVRSLKKLDESTALTYGIFNRSFVIIARDEETYSLVINKIIDKILKR